MAVNSAVAGLSLKSEHQRCIDLQMMMLTVVCKTWRDEIYHNITHVAYLHRRSGHYLVYTQDHRQNRCSYQQCCYIWYLLHT